MRVAFAIAVVAACMGACDHGSVDVRCDQVDSPGEGSTQFDMWFTVNNKARVAATRLVFEIADTDLNGDPMGESSTYTLSQSFAPGQSSKVLQQDVPEPPHWHPAKFSKLDCTLKHVTFADGTGW